MNIDTALRRREALEEMTGDETLALTYQLLDEVARLRASGSGSEHAAICVPIERVKDELIRELTKHADTMCNLLIQVRDGAGAPYSDRDQWYDLNEAIAAYQDSTKEC